MGVLKQWLPYVLSGISAGGQYALIAVGYTMVYGILRLINFAHGDIFMVAGLIMVYLSATMPLYFALPVVVILTVALGFAVERCAYKPLRQAHERFFAAKLTRKPVFQRTYVNKSRISKNCKIF